MIPQQISITLIASLAAAITIAFTLIFLPAIVELTKPKDAGPRMLVDSPAKITLGMLNIPIIDLEEGQRQAYQPALVNVACFYAIQDLEF